MAYTSGTATGYLNLLRTFRDWVCDTANLGTQAWFWLQDNTGVAGTSDGSVHFMAPGTSGVTRLVVESCESAWTAGSNVTATLDTTDYQVGSGAANLAVDVAATAGQILGYRNFTSVNLSSYTRLHFRIKSTVALSAGDLQIVVDDTNNCASPLESLNVPQLNANTWASFDVALATPANLTAVVSVGVKMAVDKGAFTVLVDDIRVTGTFSERIFMNINTISSVPSDWYNWELNGAIGFDPNIAMINQPGAISPGVFNGPKFCLHTGNIGYRIAANGRRAVILCNVAGVVESAYIGFFQSYAPPANYPYPMLIGGTNYQNVKYSDVTVTHQWLLKYNSTQTLRHTYIRTSQGVWMQHDVATYGASARICFAPYGLLDYAYVTQNADQSHPMLPCMLLQWQSNTQYDFAGVGELDGVFWVPGVLISNGDTLVVGGDNYTAFADTFRTDYYSYAALKMA